MDPEIAIGTPESKQWQNRAGEYEKAIAADLPADVDAFRAEVEAECSDVCKCGHSIPDDHSHGECEIEDCSCEGLPDLVDELETRTGLLMCADAIIRKQAAELAKLENERDEWKKGHFLASSTVGETIKENRALRERLAKLETAIDALRRARDP
jgi:hypothetical protein